jgi:hypothetical protein
MEPYSHDCCGTDYLMAVIYIKEFRNQASDAAYKAATNKTED